MRKRDITRKAHALGERGYPASTQTSVLRMTDYFDPRVLARIDGYELRSLRLVESFMTGMHKSRLLGISTEFAQHRQYVAGDDTKHLDWKVFAKTDRYFVKQYEAETNMQVVFVLDCSQSMFFRSDTAPLGKYDYAATIISTLTYLLLQQQDLFGLALFDGGLRTLTPARGAQSHYRNLLKMMQEAKPARQTDVAEAFFQIAPQLKRRSLVVVLSDFLTDTDRLALGLGQISFGEHDVVLFHVEDPEERDFPYRGQTIFNGSENEGKLLCDPRDLRQAYLNARHRHLTAVRETSQQFGYDVIEMPTDGRMDDTLAKFLAYRQSRRARP